MFAATFATSTRAADKLTPENVANLIPQLFRLHLSQHEMTPEFTKRMIKQYLQELDPFNRFYLKSEADEIINKSDEELAKIAEAAKNGDFSLFHSILENFIKVQVARDKDFYEHLDRQADEIKKEAEKLDAVKKVADATNKIDEKMIDKKAEKVVGTEIKKEEIKKEENKEAAKKEPDSADHEAKPEDKTAGDEDEEDAAEAKKALIRPATHEERISRIIKSAAWYFRSNKTYLSEQESMKLALNNIAEEYTKWAKVDVDTETPKVFLKAFMAAMDPHTVYFDEDQESFGDQLKASFAGIGVKIRPCPMGAQVEELIEGGPAEKSGQLAQQDQIIAVDGVSLAGLPINKIVMKIKGEKGTDVRLTVAKKATKATEVVTLKRAEIQLAKERVKFKRIETPQGSIGLLSVQSFYQDVSKEVKERLQEAIKEKPLAGIVLDLRANQGGYLDEAVNLAGLFIETGPIVGERNGAGFVEWRPDRDPFYFPQPLVILTSQLSASASEIVAGALKDYGRAVIVGSTQTFGKGTVQRVIPLGNTLNLPGEIKITTHQYFVAGGESTQLNGVTPDVVIPGGKLIDDLLEKASDNPVPFRKIDSAIDTAADSTRKEAARWQDWKKNTVAMLQENSKKRLEHNQKYKDFFDVKKRKEKYEAELAAKKKLNPDEAPAPEKKKDEEDPQADEAALIAADMATTWPDDKPAAASNNKVVEEPATK